MKKFGFFNSVNGDRKYLASDISNAFDIAIGTGLAPTKDCFKIVINEKMTVKMKSGGAMIYGCYVNDTDDEVIQLDTAHGELNRIDRIVLRFDKFERSIKTVVISGTPALNPVAPVSLKTENQFDLVLADIRISKATTEIKEENIVDMRDGDLCGYLGGKVLEENIQGITQSLSTTGYRKMAGGLILQWASGVSINGGQGYRTAVLPIKPPNRTFVAIVTQYYDRNSKHNNCFTTQVMGEKINIYVRRGDGSVPQETVAVDLIAICN